MHFSLSFVTVVAFYSTLVSCQPTSIWDWLPFGFLTPSASQTNCRIRVYQGNKPLGYISSQRNAYGEYGTLQDSPSGALSVSFSASRGNSNELSLKVSGAGADMPMFGGIMGFTTENDNLATGTHNYAYIGLTPQTPAGSIPRKGTNSFDKVQNFERKIQSSIWSFDSSTKRLTPQWVNANRATPRNYLLHVPSENTLVFTADKTEFGKVLNVAFSEVTLNCAA